MAEVSAATQLVFHRVYSVDPTVWKDYRVSPEWWPEHIHVTEELLEKHDGSVLEEGEGWLTIRVENGEATYRFVGRDRQNAVVEYDLLDGR